MFSFKRTLLYTASLILLFSNCISQSPVQRQDSILLTVYNEANLKYGLDKQLVNGIYFEDIYRGAKGDPYLNGEYFEKGDLVFHNKTYEGADLKYDIFQQQLLIQHQLPGFALTTIITKEFLSEFHLNQRVFRKITFTGSEPAFYQVVSDEGELQCYYSWYKERNEIIKDDDTKLFSFSDSKRKLFIFKDGILSRYHNNSSFIRLFPDDIKSQVRRYMKTNDLKVNKASDEQIRELINFCRQSLDQQKM